MWYPALTQCCILMTDGLVDADLLADVAHYADVPDERVDEGVKALVRVVLWHDHRTVKKCDDCAFFYGKVAAGSFVFHDYWEYQPTKNQVMLPIEFLRRKRADALKHDRRLVEQIIARDGYRCRYCGCEVNAADKRGPSGLTYDHVDPFLGLRDPDYGNRLSNVVIACRKDNGVKRDRTPDEAGMTLRPPPVGTRSRPGRDRDVPSPDLVSRARDARDGAGRVETEPRPSRDQMAAGNGSGNGHGGKHG